MAPVGSPGALASVVANGDEDYAELVKSVRAETDGTEVTVEILEVILRGFAEVKKKKAMRARVQDIAETMIDSGVGTFEDFRDAVATARQVFVAAQQISVAPRQLSVAPRRTFVAARQIFVATRQLFIESDHDFKNKKSC